VALGYAIGPGLGGVVSLIIPNPVYLGKLEFSQYNFPGYISFILCFIYWVLTIIFLIEPPPIIREASVSSLNSTKSGTEIETSTTETHSQHEEEEETYKETPRAPSYLFYIMVILSGIGMFLFSVDLMGYESELVPFTQSQFSWGVWQNGITTFIFGILMFISVKFAALVSRYIQERKLWFLAQFIQILSYLPFIQLPGEKFVPLWRFIVGSIIFNVANTLSWFILYPIYSKMLKPDQQAMYMSYLQQGVMLGRSFGAIYTGYALGLNNNLVFFGIAGANLVYFLVCLPFYRGFNPNYINPPSKRDSLILN